MHYRHKMAIINKITILRKNLRDYLINFVIGKDFINKTKQNQNKKKIEKIEYFRIKNFLWMKGQDV